jgi:hypothetical protein
MPRVSDRRPPRATAHAQGSDPAMLERIREASETRYMLTDSVHQRQLPPGTLD